MGLVQYDYLQPNGGNTGVGRTSRIDKIEFAKPIAIFGVLCSCFLPSGSASNRLRLGCYRHQLQTVIAHQPMASLVLSWSAKAMVFRTCATLSRRL